MSCRNKAHSATVGCCGILSITGIVAGAITAVTLGSTCGVGYLLLGGASGASFIIFKNMRIPKELEDSVTMLQTENQVLKQKNDRFQCLNDDLEQNNRELEKIKDGLQSDIEIITESVKIVGESTEEFMEKLKQNYEQLKIENDRHQSLNRQQGMYQLMQLFTHFDSNSDFILSEEELLRNQEFIRSLFPQFDTNLFKSQVTFEELARIL